MSFGKPAAANVSEPANAPRKKEADDGKSTSAVLLSFASVITFVFLTLTAVERSPSPPADLARVEDSRVKPGDAQTLPVAARRTPRQVGQTEITRNRHGQVESEVRRFDDGTSESVEYEYSPFRYNGRPPQNIDPSNPSAHLPQIPDPFKAGRSHRAASGARRR